MIPTKLIKSIKEQPGKIKKDIESRIKDDEKRELEKKMMDILNDRVLCRMLDINYVSPSEDDIKKAFCMAAVLRYGGKLLEQYV